MDDGTSEKWFGPSGVMKKGPFVVADRSSGPLITERGNLVLYVAENGQSQFTVAVYYAADLQTRDIMK